MSTELDNIELENDRDISFLVHTVYVIGTFALGYFFGKAVAYVEQESIDTNVRQFRRPLPGYNRTRM